MSKRSKPLVEVLEPAEEKPEPKRVRHRKFITLELRPSQRAKLDRMVAAKGEWATMAGVLRDLLDKAPE